MEEEHGAQGGSMHRAECSKVVAGFNCGTRTSATEARTRGKECSAGGLKLWANAGGLDSQVQG